ncbi:MAG: hypothetical protein AMJ38_03430 [Dehalococcoidia bacterium DG_22]|nr:MAG: hypothetical protein AMJ38_03430 [Dehalococcoidia bacterium DG_22]
MIKVTDQAAEILEDMRAQLVGSTDEERGDKLLRLMHTGRTFGVGLDVPHEGDQVVQSEGKGRFRAPVAKAKRGEGYRCPMPALAR